MEDKNRTSRRFVAKRRVSARSLETRLTRGIESLDRLNSLSSNCDNKASFVLAAFFVMLTILMQKEIVVFIYEKAKCRENDSVLTFIESLLLVSSVAFMFVGVVSLCSVLWARVKNRSKRKNREISSIVHFDGVTKFEKEMDYLKAVRNTSNESYWIDLEKQVYRLSCKVRRKYSRFKQSLILFLFGTITFVLFVLSVMFS